MILSSFLHRNTPLSHSLSNVFSVFFPTSKSSSFCRWIFFLRARNSYESSCTRASERQAARSETLSTDSLKKWANFQTSNSGLHLTLGREKGPLRPHASRRLCNGPPSPPPPPNNPKSSGMLQRWGDSVGHGGPSAQEYLSKPPLTKPKRNPKVLRWYLICVREATQSTKVLS